jgi:deoxyuridine 5'-triphosphate nucleotidohydrolase
MTNGCLLVQRNHPKAIIPERGSEGAAGYDLFSVEDRIIPARGQDVVDVGISIQIPSGFYGRVAARSGISVKNRIHVGAGVVDKDYRGNLKIVLFSLSDEDFYIKQGDKIAQLVLESHAILPVIEGNLDDTERGERGFGSTGMRSLVEETLIK